MNFSILVARVQPVELAQQRWPDQRGRAQFLPFGIVEQLRVLVDDTSIDWIGRWSQHPRAYLHGAGAFEVEHSLEGRCDRAADGQRAVVAQQHMVFVAE